MGGCPEASGPEGDGTETRAPSPSRRSRTRWSMGTAPSRQRGPPARPCGTARSASSISARSRPTSAPGCKTSSSAPTPTTSRIRAHSWASSFRPARTDPGPAHGGRPAGRQGGPQGFLILLSLEQLVFSLGVAWVVRTPAPVPRPPRGHGAPRRRGQRHVRADLCRHPPGAGRPGRPARCDLAELGPDERLPGDRSDHRQRAYHLVGPAWVFAGNAVTYLFVVTSLMIVTLPAVPR